MHYRTICIILCNLPEEVCFDSELPVFSAFCDVGGLANLGMRFVSKILKPKSDITPEASFESNIWLKPSFEKPFTPLMKPLMKP